MVVDGRALVAGDAAQALVQRRDPPGELFFQRTFRSEVGDDALDEAVVLLLGLHALDDAGVRAMMPCLMALRLTAARPLGVLGPVFRLRFVFCGS